MFNWATQGLEKLAQTVAPPPTDAKGRFVYCVQKDDESGAQGCLAEMDPFSVVQPTKGSFPLHMACLHGMERLIRQLMSIPGSNIQVTDGAGNTPLHYACMSTNTKTALHTIQLLVGQFQASVVTKNYSHQTPYDLATINSVRQYLLPLQLQAETQYALDNGGVGLPPGIDMGGNRIKNSAIGAPPVGGMGGPPGGGPPAGGAYPIPPMGGGGGAPAGGAYPIPPMGGGGMPPQPAAAASPYLPSTPQQQQPPAAAAPFGTPSPSVSGGPPPASSDDSAPSSTTSHARTGHSSAYMPSNSKYRPDGFHSSSSDVNLQKKYGHVSSGNFSGVAPPPSSGNSSLGGGGTAPPPSSGGSNPYARGPAKSRYPAPNSGGGGYGFYGPGAPAAPASGGGAGYTTFNPAAAAATPGSGQQQQPAAHQPGYEQQPAAQQQYQQPAYEQQPGYQHQQAYQQPAAAAPYQQPSPGYQQQPAAGYDSQGYNQQQPAYDQQQGYQQQAAVDAYQQPAYPSPSHQQAPAAASSFLPPPPMSSLNNQPAPAASPYAAAAAQQQQPAQTSPYATQHKSQTQDAAAAFSISAPEQPVTYSTPIKEAAPPAMPLQQAPLSAVSMGSTASAEELFSSPSQPAAEQSPADAFSQLSVAQQSPVADAVQSPTDAFAAQQPVQQSPADAFSQPPAVQSPTDAFAAQPAVQQSPADASFSQTAPVASPAARVVTNDSSVTSPASDNAADVFGSPNNNNTAVSELTTTPEKPKAAPEKPKAPTPEPSLEDSDFMEDVPLSNTPVAKPVLSEAPKSASDFFGLPPPPTFGTSSN